MRSVFLNCQCAHAKASPLTHGLSLSSSFNIKGKFYWALVSHARMKIAHKGIIKSCILPFSFCVQPDPPTSNKWQLDNWLTKVNPPAVPTESLSEIAHGDGCEEGKEQGQAVSSNSSHQRAEPREPHHKSSGRAARAPQDAHLLTKRNCQKSPVRAEGPSPRQTVGIKGPSKGLVHEGPKGGLKVESDPGPFEVRDQSSRDKPKVKTKGKPKSSDRKDLTPALQEPPENRKHKSSHQANAKPFLDPKVMRDVLLGSVQEHLALSPLPQGQGTSPTRTSGHRPAIVAREDFHKEKLPLPIRGKKLLSPVRDSPAPQSLMVKIDLPLLSRVPQPPGKGSHQKRAEAKEPPGARKQDLERKITDTLDKSLQKRKVRGGGGFVQGPRWCLKNPCGEFISAPKLGVDPLRSSFKGVIKLLKGMCIKAVHRGFLLVTNALLSK